MEHARQGSPLGLKPSDLDPEGRQWAALIYTNINGATGVICKHTFMYICT